MTVQTHDQTTEDTTPTTIPEPVGTTAVKELKAKKPAKPKLHKPEPEETVEPTPSEAQADSTEAQTTTTETREEEQPERKIPKVGKGGPMAWLKRMAMLYGDHPRSMARSPNILSAAGVDPALLTEELLKEATKVCLPAAQAWAKRVNEEGKESVEIVETTWFNYGVVEVARQKILPIPTSPNGTGAPKPTRTPRASRPKNEDGSVKNEHGVARSHDLPWNEKKVAVFKALKKLKALSSGSARSAKEVATTAGVTTTNVRHYCYHAKASHLTDVVVIEGVSGYSFYLTEKGQAIDPDAELKAGR